MGKPTDIRTGASATERLSPPQKAKIDEYGELQRRRKLAKPDDDRAEVLAEEIKGWYAEDDAKLPIQASGEKYEVYLSPRRNERTVTDKKRAFSALKKALGMDGLIAALDFPIGLIDKNVPASVSAVFTHKERSGYRTMDVVALQPADELRKAA